MSVSSFPQQGQRKSLVLHLNKDHLKINVLIYLGYKLVFVTKTSCKPTKEKAKAYKAKPISST